MTTGGVTSRPMTRHAAAVFVIGAAYLVGSIPFALLIGRMKGLDLRRVGTGNVGAGNLTGVWGWPAGLTAALLDVGKGLLPFLVGPALGVTRGAMILAGLAAVAGHNWSIFLGGRAGRGLATSVGVVLGLNPALLVWTTVWAVMGWKIGGGFGGFVGWGLLPIFVMVTPFAAADVPAAHGLATLMIVRRAQGGRNREPGLRAMVHRIVFDPSELDPGQPSTSERSALA